MPTNKHHSYNVYDPSQQLWQKQNELENIKHQASTRELSYFEATIQDQLQRLQQDMIMQREKYEEQLSEMRMEAEMHNQNLLLQQKMREQEEFERQQIKLGAQSFNKDNQFHSIFGDDHEAKPREDPQQQLYSNMYQKENSQSLAENYYKHGGS